MRTSSRKTRVGQRALVDRRHEAGGGDEGDREDVEGALGEGTCQVRGGEQPTERGVRKGDEGVERASVAMRITGDL